MLKAYRILLIAALAGSYPIYGQYDKVAALGSDSSLSPIGGPASSPLIFTDPYRLRDLRPTGRLNDHLPKWIQFGLDERFRIEGFNGGGFKPNNSDSYLLNRLRFGMLIQPVSWFKVVTQVQDARSFFQQPTAPPNSVRWDLKLAYAQFGDTEKNPVSLTVGRQLLDYNNTILGNSEWRNQGRSYDGVAANFHVDRFRAALFAASVVNPLLNGISHHQEGNNIYGVYGWITRVLPQSSIEPFTLWRVAPSVAEEASSQKTGRLDERAYGFRIKGKNIANLDYRYELIEERGSAGSNDIHAWATTTAVGYTVARLDWKPRFFAGYDYASGDKNPTDGTHGTFDTMYPTAHDRFGVSDQFGWQNILSWRAGATLVPRRRWSVTGQYLNFWLASATDAMYNTSGGTILRDITGKSGRHIGEEFDVYTWFEVNRQIHIGTGVAHLLPGEFIDKAGKGASYTYPYFVVEMFDGKRVR
jgi:hypothetical protein